MSKEFSKLVKGNNNKSIPQNEIHLNKAIKAQNSGKSDEAILLYEKCLRNDEENIFILKNLASIYIQSNNKEKTIKLLERIIELQPDDIAIYSILASTYLSINATDL